MSAWKVLGAASLAQVGVSLVEQGIPTLTGFIKTDLKLSAATAGLAVSSFSFGRIVGSYAAGTAADRIGERRVLLVGGLATGALVALAAAAPVPVVFLLLVLAGIGGASATPAGGRMVLLAFPRQRRGLALSIRQCGIPLGGLCAAVLLPRIAHVASWRWSLVAAAGGTVMLALPLLATPSRDGASLGPGVRPPVHSRNVVLLTVWGCLVVTGQYALLAFLALDLHQADGMSLTKGSLLVAFANVLGILGRILWGALSDRLLTRGRKPVLLFLTSAGLGSALLLFAVPRPSPLGVSLVAAGFAGLALIGYQGLWITMLTEAAGPARVGAATGFAVTFVTVAIALTAPVYGLVADLTGSYRAIWIALAGVLTLAFVPAFLVRESAPELCP